MTDYDKRRGSSTKRGYGSRWQRARLTYLKKHPLCAMCEREGRITAASVVDHKTPHKGDSALFWDVQGNWQSLCVNCHSQHKQQIDIRGYSGQVGSDGWPTDPNHPSNKT